MDLKSLRDLIRLFIESEVLMGNEDEEESVEEMASCGGAGSVGAFGYQLPLGMDSDSVNVGAADTRSGKNAKKRNKKEKK